MLERAAPLPPIVLRPDQDDVRRQLREALRTHGSVLCYAPTGFGKTVLAAALIKAIIGAGHKVIFCVHRVDLIRQTELTFQRFGIPYSHIAAGYRTNKNAPVFIASISTLKNRLGLYAARYVMVDEAHLSAANGWATVALHYKESGARLIGLTGSPERLDGKPLGDVWDTMVMGPSVSWLMANGHLSKYRAFAPAGIDLSAVHTSKSTGDYVVSELDEIMAGKAVLSGAVRHWNTFAKGMRTIAFTPSVARSEQLAAEFRANGINAVALDGNTPQAERVAAFTGFADRVIELIVNCALFCEGFDLSAQVGRDVTVEAMLDYAPTMSLAKHLQKNGRALRADGGPRHVLLDLVGNFSRHGYPDDDREWSLEGRRKGKRAAQEEKSRDCPHCFAAHPPAPRCPECGHEYETQERAPQKLVDGELEEVDVEAVRLRRKQEIWNAKGLDALISLATDRGYKSPAKWAAHIHTARLAKEARN